LEFPGQNNLKKLVVKEACKETEKKWVKEMRSKPAHYSFRKQRGFRMVEWLTVADSIENSNRMLNMVLFIRQFLLVFLWSLLIKV
jgi:hypothetical protein